MFTYITVVSLTNFTNSSNSAGTGMKARAIISSEFFMLMEHSALPEEMMLNYTKLGVAPGGNGYAKIWDISCQGFNDTLEGINVIWHSIHYPIGISFDNAPIHAMFCAGTLRTRVTLIEEYCTIFKTAQVQLNFDTEDRQHIDRAFSALWKKGSQMSSLWHRLRRRRS